MHIPSLKVALLQNDRVESGFQLYQFVIAILFQLPLDQGGRMLKGHSGCRNLQITDWSELVCE